MSDEKKVIMQRPDSKKTISVGPACEEFLKGKGYTRAGTEKPNTGGDKPPVNTPNKQ